MIKTTNNKDKFFCATCGSPVKSKSEYMRSGNKCARCNKLQSFCVVWRRKTKSETRKHMADMAQKLELLNIIVNSPKKTRSADIVREFLTDIKKAVNHE